MGYPARPLACAVLPCQAASDVHATWFRKALDAGVRMALGSDIHPLKDAALLEMGLWVRDGATPWQTLVAATRHGAAVCGVDAELGTVEVGKFADLIVVGANPLEDITNVRCLQLVLKEGRVVSDKRHSASSTCMLTAPRLIPCAPTNCAFGLPRWPMS